MANREWQEYDGAYKELSRLRGLDLLAFLGVAGRVEIEKVDSIALRIKERRLDAVFEVRIDGVERIIAVECEHSLGPPLEPRLLIALGVLLKRFPDKDIELYVLGLTGGRKRFGRVRRRCGGTWLVLKYPIVPLRTFDARCQVEAAPLGVLPFLPLMSGIDEGLLARAQERIVKDARGFEESRELLDNLYIFAGIHFSEEDIVAIANRIRQKNSYLELKARLHAEGEAEGEARGKAEERRRLVAELIAKKFPKQKRTLIDKNLEGVEDPAFLETLALRALDPISWKEFWAPEAPVAAKPALKRSRSRTS